MDSSPNADYRSTSPPPSRRRKRVRFLYERRVLVFSILCALPGLIAFGISMWALPWTNETRFSVIALLVFVSLILIAVLHDQIIRPIQTLTNVVSALREEDYSFRARGAAPNDALGELALEVNQLADLLAAQRTRTIEATALLRRVVDVVSAPLFAFDPDGLLRLVNLAGMQLLQKPESALMGRSGEQIGLGSVLGADNETQISLPQTPNIRWLVRRSQFRQGGVPHTLMVLSDVSRVLRNEERSAWQRLIRVLGHELNNSLAPIKSIAGTLAMRLATMNVPDNERSDFRKGLNIIEARSASLNRFLQAYRRLAQMPQPALRPVQVSTLIERIVALEWRVKVSVVRGPEITVMLDPDQIEQMLINVVKNAVEASAETGDANAEVKMAWSIADGRLEIRVIDCGPGLLNPDNVFVPFYTTKSEGTGIGLVLSRQIAEAHLGSLQLSNRTDARGAVATASLPLRADSVMAVNG